MRKMLAFNSPEVLYLNMSANAQLTDTELS